MQSVLICNQVSDAQISIRMTLLATFEKKKSMDSIAQRNIHKVSYVKIPFLALARVAE